jgi:spore maturation protein B
VFDTFVEGAKEGLKSSISILPTLVGLIMSVSMLSASGALDLMSSFLAPAARVLGLPVEVMPLAIVKPFSGSGSTAVLTQIYKDFGPDSVASVMSGSTETTFYAVAVYFGSVGIKKTRHTIPAALVGDLTAFILSSLTVHIFFPGC